MLNFLKKSIFGFMKLSDVLYNKFILKYKKVSYDSYPTIHGKIFIAGGGKLKLGKGVAFNSGKYSNPIGGDLRMTIGVSKNALLEIGDYTGMSNSAIICHEHIKIGSYVKVGGNVKIYDTDFHSLDPIERSNPKTDVGKTKPVLIGDYCFIGAHSILLKGITIGDKSIIGAGSVVAKSIPEGEIWGGNPAKFIKKINT
ncbi:MAG: acyltransferase [Flavobacteriaceae bacterium]